jgi:hypothetical protein
VLLLLHAAEALAAQAAWVDRPADQGPSAWGAHLELQVRRVLLHAAAAPAAPAAWAGPMVLPEVLVVLLLSVGLISEQAV